MFIVLLNCQTTPNKIALKPHKRHPVYHITVYNLSLTFCSSAVLLSCCYHTTSSLCFRIDLCNVLIKCVDTYHTSLLLAAIFQCNVFYILHDSHRSVPHNISHQGQTSKIKMSIKIVWEGG